MENDKTVGTVDLPSFWNQKPRQGLWLHWDGNNDLVEERNKSAAIGAGATPDSLDLPSMTRIEQWIWDLQPPAYPATRIDAARPRPAPRLGRRLRMVSRVRAAEHRTGDAARRHRHRHGARPLVHRGARRRDEQDWRRPPVEVQHFRKTEGYANMPLDGLWLRAPYLHNGSVPDLRALLFPEERPATFYRAYDVYDWTRVGFVSSGVEAERNGIRFDTKERGNGNAGHLYGTTRSREEKEALLEYLKTL